jgi:DNA-binding NarL/FixJ family response regulator
MVSPIRVGILEDHPLMREVVASALELAGMQVVVSEADAPRFLAAVASEAVDVVLVDLALADSGALAGVEVLRHLAAFHPHVRTLVLSGCLTPSVREECLVAGALAFLPKNRTLGSDLVPAVVAAAHGQGAEGAPAVRAPAPGGVSETLARVTQREREVLSLVSGGADNLKISALLGITERTAKAHVASLYRKLEQENRVELALEARRLGVLPPQRP